MRRQLTISSKVSIICAPHWHIRLTFTSGRQRATLTLETPDQLNLAWWGSPANKFLNMAAGFCMIINKVVADIFSDRATLGDDRSVIGKSH
jgi:hypothetical protein